MSIDPTLNTFRILSVIRECNLGNHDDAKRLMDEALERGDWPAFAIPCAGYVVDSSEGFDFAHTAAEKYVSMKIIPIIKIEHSTVWMDCRIRVLGRTIVVERDPSKSVLKSKGLLLWRAWVEHGNQSDSRAVLCRATAGAIVADLDAPTPDLMHSLLTRFRKIHWVSRSLSNPPFLEAAGLPEGGIKVCYRLVVRATQFSIGAH